MTQFYTLRETLRELSEQGPAITVCAGANSPFGREGRRVNPGTLLDTLPSETLDCLVIRTLCVSGTGTGEYRYNRREEIDEIYLFTPQGKYQPEPVLLVYRADDTPADRGANQSKGSEESQEREEHQGRQIGREEGE